jgi:hypothetical protein
LRRDTGNHVRIIGTNLFFLVRQIPFLIVA